MALPVSPALALPISLDGFRVGLPVLVGVIGMAVAPFLLAVPADLLVLGVGVELAAVIFPAALPLAIRSTANNLLGMIAARLEKLLAAAAAATHQGAPNHDLSLYCEQGTSATRAAYRQLGLPKGQRGAPRHRNL